MSTIDGSSPILAAVWTQLEAQYGWTPTDVSQATIEIDSSSLLNSQLLALEGQNWHITLAASGYTETNVYDPSHIGTITVSNISNALTNGTSAWNVSTGDFTPFNKAATFVESLAYEVGHAEDPQLNNIDFGGTDLALGRMLLSDY